MSEYSTYDEHGWVHVYDLEDCLRAIRVRNKNNEDRIKYLEKKNKELTDEHYKDQEMQKMREQLSKLEKDYYRGFPISEAEQKAIEAWKKKHDEADHGYTTERQRMRAEGCSGGRYTFHFVPSAVGTSGTIECSCGAKFEFQEIG